MSRFNTPISGKKNENGLMQIEVFPLRVLNVETAQKLIDELNTIGGITRMVVHGPRLPKETVSDLLEGKFDTRGKTYLNIKGEKVELSVQVGRIWIEIDNIDAIEQIRKAAETVLPFPFEMYEGVYIRTKKTLTDYVRKGGNVDEISVGLFDPKAKPQSSCCSHKGADE